MTMMRHARELVFSPGVADCARNEVARGGGIWVTVVVPSVGLVCPDDVAPQSPPSLLLSANRLFFAATRTGAIMMRRNTRRAAYPGDTVEAAERR